MITVLKKKWTRLRKKTLTIVSFNETFAEICWCLMPLQRSFLVAHTVQEVTSSCTYQAIPTVPRCPRFERKLTKYDTHHTHWFYPIKALAISTIQLVNEANVPSMQTSKRHTEISGSNRTTSCVLLKASGAAVAAQWRNAGLVIKRSWAQSPPGARLFSLVFLYLSQDLSSVSLNRSL